MPAIRVLSDEVVNLISAGEVVERPASVVKELVENSIDAGAASVGVSTERGGRQSITVRDDGCGMSRHDLLLSVQRHATSKIMLAKDLDSLSTLGFRGEALPSIASVTRLSIVTSDGSEAWALSMEGGVLGGVTPAARTRGTTVTASGIFFNQPVRRRFLRSEGTEESWVRRHLEGLAFSNDNVSISLSCDGRESFSIPAGTLESRLRARFGIPDGVLAAAGNASAGPGTASVVFFPDRTSASRQHVYVVVDGRPVSVRSVSYVLESMLAGPAGCPVCVCRLDLLPGECDVNVHPAKLEVRLRNPSGVQALVASAVSAASAGRSAAVGLALGVRAAGTVRRPASSASQDGYDRPPDFFDGGAGVMSPGPDLPANGLVAPRVSAVQQVGRRYLVSSVSGGIVIVDPHAAHERVLFESIRKGVAGRQRLLLPEQFDPGPGQAEQFEAFRDMLTEAGFEIDASGGQYTLMSVPEGVRHGAEAVMEILSALSEPSKASLPPLDQIAAAAACAGAVKLGDALDPEQAAELLDMLFATSDPFHCPHGRPTLIEISDAELARRFGR
ncbi:MAG: DNA mismatch repair endonuclease MutL [Candidatus Fermentibacter sp.]|nr:DNA mismatch repair endonuclease MutL [Candidatus Fermentibacter sp.]